MYAIRSYYAMMAMAIGYANKGLSADEFTSLVDELYAIPEKIEKILEKAGCVKEIAGKIKDSSNSLYLGRGYLFRH